MFEHIPNEKSIVYGPNGKGIMAPIEYTLKIYSLNGKSMVLWKILFWSDNHNGKRYKNTAKQKQCLSKLV